MDLSSLKSEAELLGLTGDGLTQYILSAQNYAREERAKERELERVAREREEKDKEREERAKEREHELELATLNSTSSQSSDPLDLAGKPKLPTYREGEDIGSFLTRFERIAKLLCVKKESYAVRLGTVLTGKCVDIYTSLSDEVTSDYELLKKALLSGFQKTADGYRQEFRAARIKVGETYDLFAVHLGRLFDQWIIASEVDKTYDSLKGFMILDQLLSSVAPELRVYLKENDVTSVAEAVKLANCWPSAHRSSSKFTSNNKPKKFPDKIFRPQEQTTPSSETTQASKSSGKKDYSKVTCHGCGEKGHIRPNCPKNPQNLAKKL